MITVVVALMTLPCHCWGQVRLSRQEWPCRETTVPSLPTHVPSSKSSLSHLWSQDPQGGGSVMEMLLIGICLTEEHVHSHTRGISPGPL